MGKVGDGDMDFFEACSASNLSEESARNIMKASKSRIVASLDYENSMESDALDFVPDLKAVEPKNHPRVLAEENEEVMSRVLKYAKNNLHRSILYKRYILGFTLEEISQERGVSKEAIRQIEKKAIMWIRKSKKAMSYSDLV